MLLFEASALPWTGGEPGDFLRRLAKDDGKLRRLPLDGRPMGLAFLPNTAKRWIANYLLDALQVVDIRQDRIAGRLRWAARPVRRWPGRARRCFTTPAARTTSGSAATPAMRTATPAA